MKRNVTIAVVGLALVGAAAAALAFSEVGREAQFVFGGALVNVGYRLQDHLERFDFRHHEGITPEEIWGEIQKQNRLASSVRSVFPRSHPHPLVALVVCMDSRIDTNELTGDTRQYYYIVRTAGSVLAKKEEEMLELAVEKGVKLVILTTHTDCAAERAAKSEELRQRFPSIVAAVDDREQHVRHFLARPPIAERIKSGQLAVKLVNIDTMTEKMLPQ